jgi:hypothetical protein
VQFSCATAVGTYSYRRAPNAEIAGNEPNCGQNLTSQRNTLTPQALAKSSHQIAMMMSPDSPLCQGSVLCEHRQPVSRLNAGSQVKARRLPPQTLYFAFSETSRQSAGVKRLGREADRSPSSVFQINTLRTGSFKLFKRPFPRFLAILTL